MGSDTTAYLPPTTRVHDAAEVLAILLGHPGELQKVAGGYTKRVRVRGVMLSPYSSKGLESSMSIDFIGEGNGMMVYSNATWNYEGSDTGERTVHMGRSHSLGIALAVGIVDFFGGWVDFDNEDDILQDHFVEIKYPVTPHGGKEWDEFQSAKLAVAPITVEDIARYDGRAVYATQPPAPYLGWTEWLDADQWNERKAP